ncbi:MAG: DUF1542 domain-containing protein [Cystobacterineae bacterium]|nr:DUF1542 domain-containing protein [Cystobacterineae bacterium]
MSVSGVGSSTTPKVGHSYSQENGGKVSTIAPKVPDSSKAEDDAKQTASKNQVKDGFEGDMKVDKQPENKRPTKADCHINPNKDSKEVRNIGSDLSALNPRTKGVIAKTEKKLEQAQADEKQKINDSKNARDDVKRKTNQEAKEKIAKINQDESLTNKQKQDAIRKVNEGKTDLRRKANDDYSRDVEGAKNNTKNAKDKLNKMERFLTKNGVKALNSVGKIAKPFGLGMSVIQVTDALKKSPELGAYEAGKQTSMWAGSAGGAALGMAIGTAIFPGVGTFVGGVVGGWLGGEGGTKIYETFVPKPS